MGPLADGSICGVGRHTDSKRLRAAQTLPFVAFLIDLHAYKLAFQFREDWDGKMTDALHRAVKRKKHPQRSFTAAIVVTC